MNTDSGSKTFVNINLTINYGGKLPALGDSMYATCNKPTPFYIEGTVHSIKRISWTTNGKLKVTVTVEATKLTTLNNLIVVK